MSAPTTKTKNTKQELAAIGKQMDQLEANKDTLLTRARKLIGFGEPECSVADDSEFNKILFTAGSAEKALPIYAEEAAKRWKVEDALEQLKAAMSEAELTATDIDLEEFEIRQP
jgi:hypothetical protein